MKLLSALSLISVAIATTSELPTYSSTIIASASCDEASCDASSVELVPTSFAYSNNTVVGKVPVESSSSERSTIYEYETVTTDDIYEVVETVCDIYSNCWATTELESFTTYTTTVDGILTVITSGIPYSGETVEPASTTTDSEITTTLASTITATITSCDDVCYTTTEEQVLSTGTTTVNGVETEYTTYCPLSSVEPAAKAATVTDISETVITITSCSDHKCTKVPVTTGVTTVTEDNTVYTTYCPLTSEAPAASTTTKESTTVLTITSCEDKKCTPIPVTTGLTTVTKDNTVYTTYCPISSTVEHTVGTPEAKKPATSSVPAPAPTTAPKPTPAKTVDVITDNIVTQTPEAPTTVSYSATSQVTIPTASLYEGAGALAQTGILAIGFSIFLSFI